MIFAREVSDSLTSLVKKIDAATAKNSAYQMGSFVVFMSDDEGLEKKLKDLAETEKLTKTALTIDNPSGPEDYHMDKKADITGRSAPGSYSAGAVKATRAFKKGEMTGRDIDGIVEDLAKILP